jgi:hypothetical protein
VDIMGLIHYVKLSLRTGFKIANMFVPDQSLSASLQPDLGIFAGSGIWSADARLPSRCVVSAAVRLSGWLGCVGRHRSVR